MVSQANVCKGGRLTQIAVAKKDEKKSGMRWGRLLWTLFVVLYLFNFVKNLFGDVAGSEAAIPIVYFSLWLLWLGVEFYLGALFFQSSLVPNFNPWLKAGFAIYFYALQGLAPWDAFGGTEIRFLYPLFGVLGLLIFASGISVRLWSLFVIKSKKNPKDVLRTRPWQLSRHPRYIGMLLIMFAVPIVFFSPWAMLLTVVVGLPLWYLEIRFEERKLAVEWGEVYKEYSRNTPLSPRFKP